MTERKDFDINMDLDALFSEAQSQDTTPRPDFMEQVLKDALGVQADHIAPEMGSETAAKPSLLARLAEAVGGWPALGGLAVAGVAGVWIGVNPPDTVTDAAFAILNVDSDFYLVDGSTELQFDFAEG